MKISTRGRYSTRLMLELALNHGNGPTLLKDIAEKQDISMKYLSQLIMPLRVAGLITGTRGAHGGYYLARSPKNIKLCEIITAMEGSLSPTECIDNPDICKRSGECAAMIIWRELGKKCEELLESVTLEDLVSTHNKINKH